MQAMLLVLSVFTFEVFASTLILPQQFHDF